MASCPRLRPPRSFCRRAILPCSYDGAAGGLFLAAAAMTLHRFSSLGLKSRIDAAFWLFLRVSLHRFPSLALKSRIDARKRLFSGKSLHRFPSLGLKSRIGARKRLFSGKSLHRFPSLGLKSRIAARSSRSLARILSKSPGTRSIARRSTVLHGAGSSRFDSGGESGC